MTIFLKVEMEGADLPSFLKNSPFAKANFKTYKRTSTAAAPPSWLGDDLKEYIASSVSLADRPPNLNVRLDIVIDKTRQNTAVVYLLYWFP
jgi:hypothetical protein